MHYFYKAKKKLQFFYNRNIKCFSIKFTTYKYVTPHKNDFNFAL